MTWKFIPSSNKISSFCVILYVNKCYMVERSVLRDESSKIYPNLGKYKFCLWFFSSLGIEEIRKFWSKSISGFNLFFWFSTILFVLLWFKFSEVFTQFNEYHQKNSWTWMIVTNGITHGDISFFASNLSSTNFNFIQRIVYSTVNRTCSD